MVGVVLEALVSYLQRTMQSRVCLRRRIPVRMSLAAGLLLGAFVVGCGSGGGAVVGDAGDARGPDVKVGSGGSGSPDAGTDTGAGATGGRGGGGAGGQGGGAGATATGGITCPSAPDRVAATDSLAVSFAPGVQVSTLAGSDVAGATDANGADARFNNPVSITRAASGDLFVTDYDSGGIRKVTVTGAVTTVATVGGLQPFGLVMVGPDQLIIDTDRNPQGAKTTSTSTIWSVSPVTGVSTLVKADLGRTRGVALLPDGRIALGDYRNHVILILDPVTAAVTRLAGNGCPGFADGKGEDARFQAPYGLVARADGKIIVADSGNDRLRLVSLDGTVTSIVGDGTFGTGDGAALTAHLNGPVDVAIDTAGILYVSDAGGHRIRRVDASGQVTTLAGDGTAGFADGPGSGARFYGQEGLDVSPDGTTLYVADGNFGDGSAFHRIRSLSIPTP